MLYRIIRSALFKCDAEITHKLIMQYFRFISSIKLQNIIFSAFPSRPITCMGLHFPNSIGLAAGFDKNAECINIFSNMGFGFIEVGTVTPQPQVGNNKPRIFRLMEAEGIINRMGCNNYGIDYVLKNIKRSTYKSLLGINIGKNTLTPIELAKNDYIFCMEKIYPYVHYISINISSPNTPKLRMLQYGALLDDLLRSLKLKQKSLQEKHLKYVPIAIKISPDLSEKEIIEISDSIIRYNIDAVIATNTTLDRTIIKGLKYSNEAGGLSGRPLQSRSTEVIKILSKELKDKVPIIGVGGIDSLISAREKISAGATLIQLYSGLIYKGPKLIKDLAIYL